MDVDHHLQVKTVEKVIHLTQAKELTEQNNPEAEKAVN
jgi:hypothetical protein